ncbi:MAG: hypothetical protein KatS3mg002_1009 [Candidatus Woesearchaeota archaeon]|jgi:hypothetical protein|nr:MAG: hypothetical protein KatS3mg002_1009 [Candidatus Woesearchaeota archaeon]
MTKKTKEHKLNLLDAIIGIIETMLEVTPNPEKHNEMLKDLHNLDMQRERVKKEKDE